MKKKRSKRSLAAEAQAIKQTQKQLATLTKQLQQAERKRDAAIIGCLDAMTAFVEARSQVSKLAKQYERAEAALYQLAGF